MDMLKRLKQLAKRTNAPVVVVEEGEGEAFVILPLDAYERLLEGTPEIKQIGAEHKMRSLPESEKPEPRETRPEVQVVEIPVRNIQNEPNNLEEEEKFYLEPLE